MTNPPRLFENCSSILACRLVALASLIVVLTASAAAQTLVKGPWLIYPGDPSRMDILWQDDAGSVDTVRWGADSTVSDGADTATAVAPAFLQQYHVGNLVPHRRYWYRVSAGTGVYSGSFVTASPPGTKDLSFIVYGDTRTNASIHNAIADSICSFFRRDGAYQSVVLFVGDFVSDGSQESYWTGEMFNRAYTGIGSMLANLPFMTCRGNHEKNGILFDRYFPYPYVLPHYWSFNDGPVHVTVLDQYIAFDSSSEQYRWLEQDLAMSTSHWNLVLLHEPGWSAGGGHANNQIVQFQLEPLFEKYRVAVVFAGHNHYYARAVVTGRGGITVQHVTTGGGGAPLYTPQPGQPDIVAAASVHHFCTVRISGDTLLECSAISETGAMIDSFTVHRPPPPPDGINQVVPVIPGGYRMEPVYPNPANPVARFRYALASPGSVSISIYDLLGRRVATLIDGYFAAGEHAAAWNSTGYASGLYFCRLEAQASDLRFPVYSTIRSLIVVK
jgi:hypothetical protein